MAATSRHDRCCFVPGAKDLLLQLHCGQILRDYLVLLHGQLPPSRQPLLFKGFNVLYRSL